MSGPETLSGEYHLFPGASPGVAGSRPVLADGRIAWMLRGMTPEMTARTIGNIFTLCSHAHRGTCALAFAAAAQPAGALEADTIAQELLCFETIRDHLRAIALEWPRRSLGANRSVPDLGWLDGCPVPLAGLTFSDGAEQADAASRALLGLRAWLENDVIGEDLDLWLESGQDPEALPDWCLANSGGLPPARYLADHFAMANALVIPMRSLDVLDHDHARQAVELRRLAESLSGDLNFSQTPVWHGHSAETGPWTRFRHRRTNRASVQTLWTRLASRWVELIEIAAAGARLPGKNSEVLLSSGAISLGSGQAIAWSEMARGLLFHWIRIDKHNAVLDYRVLAPTEWNFHPEGSLSSAVSRLSAGDCASACLLASGFDPCVDFSVQSSKRQVVRHA